MAFLIDIEGIDGSGKGTQATLLLQRFQKEGVRAALISFPRYKETFFGGRVASFLNGEFGTLEQVDPFLVSLLYAGDRMESRDWLLEQIAQNDVVIFDRYVPSNLAHQASKKSGAAREELIRAIERIEFEIHRLPRPDVVILMDLPETWAQERVAAKAPRNYTDQKADLQEADADHLSKTREVYRELAASRENWRVVEVIEGDRPLSREEIGERIWGIVSRERAGSRK